MRLVTDTTRLTKNDSHMEPTISARPDSDALADDRDARARTGVVGLDKILNGGLPRNHLYVVDGDPGTGKTTLALQFLLEGVRNEEQGLYVSLSESRDELLGVASSHGWTLDGIEIFELPFAEGDDVEGGYTLFHPAA